MSEIIEAQFKNCDARADLALMLHSSRLRLLEEQKLFEANLRAELAERMARFKNRCRAASKRRALAEAAAEFRQKLLAAAQIYKQIILHANKECLNLAFNAAKAIVSDQLSVAPSNLAKYIKPALKELASANDIALSLSPQDAAQVSRELHDSGWPVAIRSDPKLAAGCAVITTSSGRLKLDWGANLEKLNKGLEKELERRWREKCSS